jgi:hypothetical protein
VGYKPTRHAFGSNGATDEIQDTLDYWGRYSYWLRGGHNICVFAGGGLNLMQENKGERKKTKNAAEATLRGAFDRLLPEEICTNLVARDQMTNGKRSPLKSDNT